MTYQDPGVRMVAEFHDAFECEHLTEPTMPKLDDYGVATMSSVWDWTHEMAENLKQMAAAERAVGRVSLAVALLRVQIHMEEGVAELARAIARQDLTDLLDSLTDASYVVNGSYLSFGLGHVKPAADAEVHRANMSKSNHPGPARTMAGRVIKGPNYVKPDLVKVLADERLRRAELPSINLIEKWG